MQRFWDARAKENALFYVDTRLAYGSPDIERFWSNGEADLDHLLGDLEVKLVSSDVVLDIGCGVGRLTRALCARVAEVLAIDVSEQMLERARALNPQLSNAQWLHGDGVSLAPVQDNSVTACFSHVVFQHIPDPGITLGYVREMGRVLRAGGWAGFQVSNDPAIHRPRGRPARERLRAITGRAPRGQQDERWRGSHVDLDALARTAVESGLRIERVVNPGTQYCLVLARRNEPSEAVF